MSPIVIREGDYPHGLRCMDCDRRLRPGDTLAKRLVAITPDGTFVTETVCALCPVEAALTA